MLRHVLVVLFCLVATGASAQEDHLSKLFEVHSKFAAMGSAEAQFKLGQMYEEGQGTKADIAKAREWYGKAAAQGYDKAKQRLEVLDARAAKAGSDAAAQEAAVAQKRAEEEKARQAEVQKRAEEEKARQEAVAAQKRAEEEKARQAAAGAKPATPKAEAPAATASQPESFDTDPCNTPAARFMSTCRDKK